MYSAINRCCPNRCLTICVSTVMTPTQVGPLCSLFFHTIGLHTAPVARSLFHPHYVFIANLQCTFQALQHFFFFYVFSNRFHFETCNKKAKSCCTRIQSGQHSIFFLHFSQWTFVPVVEFTWWLPRSLFFPGIPLPLPELPLLLFFRKTCFILTMFRPSRRHWPLRSSFALWWGGTSHLVPPHLGTVCRSGQQIAKAQVRHCSSKPAQACPLGQKQSMSAMNQINFNQLFNLLKEVWLGQFGRANDSPILSCSDSSWRCRASSLVSSWGSISSIFLKVSAQTMIFFSQCFLFDCSLSCEKRLVPETTRQPWLWLEPRTPCGMLGAATTQCSRSPAPASRRKNDKRNSKAHSKSCPLSGSNFFAFQNPDYGMCKYHNFYNNKAFKCIVPCSFLEN